MRDILKSFNIQQNIFQLLLRMASSRDVLLCVENGNENGYLSKEESIQNYTVDFFDWKM